jgi:hypothetical protein
MNTLRSSSITISPITPGDVRKQLGQLADLMGMEEVIL